MTRPILYLTNAASVAAVRRGTARLGAAVSVGPGQVWSIMARPRRWERGDGIVSALVPALADLDAFRAGRIDIAEYRRRYVTGLGDERESLRPDYLLFERYIGPPRVTYFGPVDGGDTLICACAREAALDGCCHTAWAAEALDAAGWDVRLHGLSLAEVRAWRAGR